MRTRTTSEGQTQGPAAAESAAGAIEISITEIERRLFGMPMAELTSALASDPRLARAWRAIEELHPDDSLTKRSVGEHAGANGDYLNVLLRNACGLTFRQLLIRRRTLSAAVLMSRDKRMKVIDVAMASGFGSVGSFERSLAKHVGVKPSSLRKLLS